MQRLNKQTQSILAIELNKAFFRAGRRLMGMYLEQLSETQALEICQSPKLLRDTIEKVLSDREAEAAEHEVDGPLSLLKQTRFFPRTSTRECLSVIEEVIRESPLDGMTPDDVCKVVYRRLGYTMKVATLTSMIRRNADFHKLVVRGNKIRLRSDILVDILTRRHRQYSHNSIPVTVPPAAPTRAKPKLPLPVQEIIQQRIRAKDKLLKPRGKPVTSR